jgi:hypothetical protein
MIGPSSTTALPGIVSQYNDRLGRIYGAETLEANWYEERIQRAAGVLKPKTLETVLRPYEPDLAAHQREISGSLAICSRTSRHPFMFQSRSVVSDGLNERISMSETFFKPLAERPPNPVGAGKTTTHDAMLMQFSQHDEPKTRQNKDRMSNIENEVRPIADSEEKIRKRFITPYTLGHVYTERPSRFLSTKGFGQVVPRHPNGYDMRQFSTTTGEALSTGRAPERLSVSAPPPRRALARCDTHPHSEHAVLIRSCPSVHPPARVSCHAQRHQIPPSSSLTGARTHFSSGGYEKTSTNHTVFTFGFAKEANALLPGMGGRDTFGKTSLIKSFALANNPPPEALAVKA